MPVAGWRVVADKERASCHDVPRLHPNDDGLTGKPVSP